MRECPKCKHPLIRTMTATQVVYTCSNQGNCKYSMTKYVIRKGGG